MEKYITKISLTKTVNVKVSNNGINKNKSKYFIIDNFADIVGGVANIYEPESSVQLTEEELNRFLEAFNNISRHIGYTSSEGVVGYWDLAR